MPRARDSRPRPAGPAGWHGPAGDRDAVAVARFHIHPADQIRAARDRTEVCLIAPDGETWLFSCRDGEVVVEEDIFFADPSGVRASSQLERHFRSRRHSRKSSGFCPTPRLTVGCKLR